MDGIEQLDAPMAGALADAIHMRKSCRTFRAGPLAPADRASIEALLTGAYSGPFGNEIRLRLMEFDADSGTGRLGTYGFITNGRYFVGGSAPRGHAGAYDYGFCLELAVLRLVAMGFGTCWLAGFQRGPVIDQLQPGPGQFVPAVVVVGWPEEQRSLREQLIRRVARGGGRKPWSQLFADAASAAPLTAVDAGAWREALEAVRLAPSAANRQRWRVLRETGGTLAGDGMAGAGHNLTWHFCSEGHAGVDMGIAMLHFEVVARELRLPGRWAMLGRVCPRRPKLLYVSSWVAGRPTVATGDHQGDAPAADGED